jgi:ferredoxin-nitrite reductase/sulfite reductase (ferredoxin)
LAVDVAAVKRAGLPVDLDRLEREGDSWLTPEDRYALKTRGVCAQAQAGAFMIRIRTDAGRFPSDAARALAGIADDHARGWVHLTTRQQVELHHVAARDVPTVLRRLEDAGLSSRSTCGHTVRGVLSCPEAGVGLEEPFDCLPDARAAAGHVRTLAEDLDRRLPQRLNISFGGCASCRENAKVNDIAFVSRVDPSGELGYELWLGGSIGKTSPRLATKMYDFLPRNDVLPALQAVLDVYCEHGDFEEPRRGRLKFLIGKVGWDAFARLVDEALAAARGRAWPPIARPSQPLSAPLGDVFARAPEGGWGRGVRPQRIPGWALATVRIPLGDLDGDDLRSLAEIADVLADESLYLTANQNVLFRHVPVDAVGVLRDRLSLLALDLDDPDHARDVRCCTGGPVCSLALTPAQSAAARLAETKSLQRHGALRINVSGCPNACAQHQIADIGFSGGKVTVAGASVLGYHVWLGGDVRRDRIGEIAGRVSAEDVPAITDAVVGVWEALRLRDEGFADTVARVGRDAFEAQISAVFRGRWEPGPEPMEAV